MWLCCLTGYVLRRCKKCFDHGGSEEHCGRPATGRSQESLEIEKLSRSIWYGSRSTVWLTKKIRDTLKVVKAMSSFNFDLIFDSDLQLYHNRLHDLHRCGTFEMFLVSLLYGHICDPPQDFKE